MGREETSQSIPYRALWDRAEVVGALGSWEWRPRSGEVTWSDNLFRLCGLEPQSAVVSVEFVIEQVHPEDRAHFAKVIEGLIEGALFETFEYRALRPDGSVRILRSVGSVVERDGDGPQLIVGSVQDITDRRSDERTIAARIAVSEALDRWGPGGSGPKEVLAALGDAMGFAFGVFLLRDGDHLDAREVWSADRRFDAAAVDKAALRRTIGGAMVGRSWTSAAPIVGPFVRYGRPPSALLDAALAAGARTALAIPAVTRDETLAVLGFISVEDLQPTEQLLRSLTGIGYELGHFFDSRRAELVPPVLTERELEVLQLAARGRAGRAIAVELDVSPATVKRHFEDIYARLGAADRAEAVGEAMRRGMIS
jgi:PAS domain S-box-containing protein